ncbi:heterogeneous nuclear ribonucleoprotein A3 homolog 2-like, partial [Acanthaster planci]|uniref:Heterogeneous nuclear ribonucleoprotein A3 homolog 2-like n=1 Tax=Acanthaster planci TaxID=133434 RepID=A0A8B7XTH4_ACAPL
MASQVTNTSEEPENLRKIFLGGLNRSTTKDDLKTHFEQFGEVTDSIVILNTEKQSKGFGFVTMATIEETDKSLRENNCGSHDICKKKVEVKRAIPRDSNISAEATNQIFVGNLGTNITEEHLREYFSQFSPVKSTKVIKEKGGDKSRGFGFVEFEEPFGHHAVDKLAIMEKHTIEGRQVYCNKAEDRSNKEDNYYGRHQAMRGNPFGRNPGRSGMPGYYDGYGGGNYGCYGGARGGYGGGGYGGDPYGGGN